LTSENRLTGTVIPSLLVRDLEETLSFYSILGFKLSGRYPSTGDPSWAEVTRDGVVLRFYTDPPKGTPLKPILSGTIYIPCRDVKGLAEELHGRVEFAWGPEVMDYGSLEFGLRDPNGYYIGFIE